MERWTCARCGQEWPTPDMTTMYAQRREAARIHGTLRCAPARPPREHQMSGKTLRLAAAAKRGRPTKRQRRDAADAKRACQTCHMVPATGSGACGCE